MPAEIAIGFDDPLADFRATAASAAAAGHRQRPQPVDGATGAAMSHARRHRPRRGDAAGYLGRPRDLRPVADRQDAGARAGRHLRRDGATASPGRCSSRASRMGWSRRIEARSIEPALLSPPPAEPRVLLPPTTLGRLRAGGDVPRPAAAQRRRAALRAAGRGLRRAVDGPLAIAHRHAGHRLCRRARRSSGGR